MNFENCVAFTLDQEGGYSNDPRDPGGPTNWGITLSDLTAWRGHDCTADDVRAMDVAEADAIYRTHYWNLMRCDMLPLGTNLMAFDFGVNAGRRTSAMELQTCLGVAVDGVIGVVTGLAAMHADPRALILALQAAHEAHYRTITTFPIFGNGWLGRLNRCAARALELAGLPSN